MNSYMNIMVRVGSAKAQAQIAAMSAQMKGLRVETMAMNRVSPFGAAAFSNLIKFGSRLQWVGRQLQYNFTLPILLAGGAAVKFAMDQEKAFTHVSKVYGSISDAQKFFMKQSHGALSATEAHTKAMQAQRNELAALDNAFTAISNQYGVQKKDVDEVAGAWAAAGASGIRLAKSVNLTMQAMIIGDMDAATATQSLISIQAQYNLNSKQLASTLAMLNNVENQTGISMSGLIDGFTRAAGVARAAGVSTKELAAELAALVPATGSAANAGNALKTIYSRLMAPTSDSMDIMKAMGLQIKTTAWQSANAADRLKLMQKAFENLGSSAKNVASSVIASRWQVNKFEVLMDQLGKKTGFYAAALKAAGNETNNFKVMQSELNTVLKSNPRSLARMGVILQNASVKIIQPLIPFIIYLAQELGKLAQAFANMDPHVQKLVLLFAVFLALVGPLVRYLGALKILIGVVGVSTAYLGGALLFLTKVMFGIPFKLLRMGFTLLATAIMSIVPESAAAVGATSLIWRGLIGFFVGWQKAVNAVFAAGNLLRLRIWVTGLVSQIMATRTWATLQLLSFKTFWLKLKLLYIAGTLEGMGLWSSMWAVMKALTIGGMATQFALFRKGMGLFAILKTLGAALVVAWATTWETLKAIAAAGWALLRAQAVVGAIAQVGIFSRLRSALVVIWTTTAAAGATIWRGMALGMVAFGRAGITGLIGVFRGLLPILATFGRFLLGPWGIAIAAISLLIAGFHTQIVQVFNNIRSYISSNFNGIARMFNDLGNFILKVFNMLPQGVQNAMLAVVQIVHDAAMAVYQLFSYINPFAQHSPSLVDNVKNGMDRIMSDFARLKGIKAYTDAAYKEIARFGKLTANINMNAQVMQQNQDRKTIAKAGGSGAALASFDRLTRMVNKLTPVLNALNAKMQAQQQVVNTWQAKLDLANNKLDRQQKILDGLNNTLSKYNDKLSAAQDRLSQYASAPLKGMQAMDDQIQANTVAQNKLKLAMMDTADKAGGSLDDLKNRLDKINGAQEMLRGKRTDLALGGAGSDILSTYDDQIKALDKQKVAYDKNASALSDMQARLDALQHAADRLDLVKALKFDDLNYQIQKAANTMKEMSFAQIMAGVKGAQSDIGKYTDKVNKATDAVNRQQKVVDALTKTRDHLQNRLDAEQKTLDRITNKYNQVNDAINAINDALQNVVSNADKMNQALADKKKKKGAAGGSLSPAMQAFKDAGKSSFPDPGGLGIGPRKNWNDQSKLIDKFTQHMANQTADMFGQINPFAPLVDKAKAAWGKIQDYFHKHNPFAGMSNPFTALGKGVKMPKGMDTVKRQFGDILSFVIKVVHDISKWIGRIWKLVGPDVKKFIKNLWDGIKGFVKEVMPELKKFGAMWKPLGKAIQNLWAIAKPIWALFTIGFLAVAKVAISVFADTIEPLLKHFGRVLAGIIRVIRGVFEIIIGILSGDWSLAWQGVLDIVTGTWKAIWNVIAGFISVIGHALYGFVRGIVNFFKWLWKMLVGHSIVPDIVKGIFKWFTKLKDLPKWVYDKALKPLWQHFVDAWHKIQDNISGWWPWIKGKVQAGLGTIGAWVHDHVLQPLQTRWTNAWQDIRDKVSNAKDKIGDTLGTMKDKFDTFVGWIRDIPGKLKDLADNFKSAGTALIEAFWHGLQNTGDLVANIAGNIWTAMKGFINSGIKYLNDKLPDKISIPHAPDINLPDNPFPYLPMYTGGVVKGSRRGTPIMAGDRGYDEAVIPLTGPYAPRWTRYQDMPGMNPKSMAPITKHQTFIFNGDLEFPNIKSGDDVDTLISNLESLAS